jgi:hypothetical protein
MQDEFEEDGDSLGIGFALLLGIACSLPIWGAVLGLIFWPF